jgi:RNA polymerase subunit RPABC4/transcription elongation factor Spt4
MSASMARCYAAATMPVCPLCDHSQESGPECAVCGMALTGGPAGEGMAATPLEGLEPTGAAPVDGASAVLLGDLEPTALAPPWSREPPSGARCPYCTRIGAPGEVFCPTCGVKLPLARPPQAPSELPDLERRCRNCGFLVAGEVCPACGSRHRET